MILKDFLKKSCGFCFRWECFFIILSFALWFVCFRDFFFGRLPLFADAISYFEHIGYYTDNLKNGIYPLWNPFWYEGAPYQFFLRRIGDVNPFLFVIIFLKWLGVSHVYAYLVFLAIYYFLSALALYLIARLVFQDCFLASIAYILFLFSSWGSQLFYNYIILIFLPIIWFFYFLLSFANRRIKSSLLGMCFCLGLIMTTYIPFYFLIVLLTFFCFYFLLYYKEFLSFLKDSCIFFQKNKGFVVLCVLFLFLASIPAMTFYKESKSGEFVMPHRSAGSNSSSAVAVGLENTVSGDIINHGFFDRIFAEHANVDLGDFFIPHLFFIILFCSFFSPINKLIWFLFLNILLLFAISITTLTGLYTFLFKHVIFFKYIRNIYYLFWIAILPMAILLTVACLRSFLNSIQKERSKLLNVLNLCFSFGCFALFLYSQGVREWITWLSYSIALFCFIYSIWRPSFIKSILCVVLLLIGVFIQSLEFYGALVNKLHKNYGFSQYYVSKTGSPFRYKNSESFILESQVDKRNVFVKRLQADLYYASYWYSGLYNFVSPNALANYTNYKFKFYDNVSSYQDNELFYKILDEAMLNNQNEAFVFQGESVAEDWKTSQLAGPYAQNVDGPSSQLRVVEFNANVLELKIHLSKPKFLVVNDNYHKGWNLTINGKKSKLLRANVAFKGFWVPAGDSRVVLKFLTDWHYISYGALIILFYGTLMFLLFLWFKENKLIANE